MSPETGNQSDCWQGEAAITKKLMKKKGIQAQAAQEWALHLRGRANSTVY
jgi:hypothetical protein